MKRLAAIATTLAILGLLIIPATALAAGGSSGDTSVGGTISTYYTLSAPTSIDLGTTISSAGDIPKGPFGVTVSTNDPAITTCGITVADKQAATKAGNAGHLMNGSYPMAAPLFLSGGDKTTNTVLAAAALSLRASSTPLASASITDFRVFQTIGGGDLAHAGAYTMTLTFTATFGP
jgi:hypothetical protein